MKKYYLDTSTVNNLCMQTESIFQNVIDNIGINKNVYISKTVQNELLNRDDSKSHDLIRVKTWKEKEQNLKKIYEEVEQYLSNVNFQLGLSIETKNIFSISTQEDFFKEVNDKIKTEHDQRKRRFNDNIEMILSVLEIIDEDYTIKEKIDLISMAELGMEYNLLPGYKDSAKNGIEKFNDLFIFLRFIELAKNNPDDWFFVTDDKKEDSDLIKLYYLEQVTKPMNIIDVHIYLRHIDVSMDELINLNYIFDRELSNLYQSDYIKEIWEKYDKEYSAIASLDLLVDNESKKIYSAIRKGGPFEDGNILIQKNQIGVIIKVENFCENGDSILISTMLKVKLDLKFVDKIFKDSQLTICEIQEIDNDSYDAINEDVEYVSLRI